MSAGEAITVSVLAGSAVGLILLALAVVLVAVTTPSPTVPSPDPAGGDDHGPDCDPDCDAHSALHSGAGQGWRTKTGRVLTPADFEALADEAEEGYDLDPDLIRDGSPRRRLPGQAP